MGTGRMGPRSMSVGPSMGGKSDLPPEPIWKEHKAGYTPCSRFLPKLHVSMSTHLLITMHRGCG